MTLEAQKQGIDQLFLQDPILFSSKLLHGRLDQFHQADQYTVPMLFYDRGMPDVTAYMDYLGTIYPASFTETCMNYCYDLIFVLPPWKEIYISDNERYESWDIAQEIAVHLESAYANYGYQPILVPTGTVAERVSFVLEELKNIL